MPFTCSRSVSACGLCYPLLPLPFPMAIPFAYLPGSPGNCIAFHLGATPLPELSSHRPELLPLPWDGPAESAGYCHILPSQTERYSPLK